MKATPHRAGLTPRDQAVVELVGTFRQMLPRQIRTVLFADCASKTPLDRSLRRLYDGRYLSRLEVRAVGGHGGGSDQHVYQLGRLGWRLLGLSGTYWVHRTVNLHTLEIAEIYTVLKSLEHEGQVQVLRFDREQDGWRDVAGVKITPDAAVELGLHATSRKVSYFLELDRGTEKAAVLREKCGRYWRAYNHWEDDTFPYVLFVTPDERRRQEVDGIILGGPTEAHAIFRTCTLAELRDFALAVGESGDSRSNREKRRASVESADSIERLSSSAPPRVWIDPHSDTHTVHVKIVLEDP